MVFIFDVTKLCTLWFFSSCNVLFTKFVHLYHTFGQFHEVFHDPMDSPNFKSSCYTKQKYYQWWNHKRKMLTIMFSFSQLICFCKERFQFFSMFNVTFALFLYCSCSRKQFLICIERTKSLPVSHVLNQIFHFIILFHLSAFYVYFLD